MLFACKFNNFIRETCPLLLKNFQRVQLKPAFVPSRSFIFKEKSKRSEDINRSNDDILSTPFTGYEDPTFTDRFFKRLQDPETDRKAWTIFLRECKKFYNEEVTDLKNFGNFKIGSKINRVDMLFTFESEEDLKKFVVNTDSSFMSGYSSASLKLTQSKTALFSGSICTEVPKDGNVARAGFANLISKRNKRSFFRIKPFNWANYTHLVLKVRGDGRTYMIIITTPGSYTEMKGFTYNHPLYTRGGPYWQVAKIPFSHFFFVKDGCIHSKPNERVIRNQVHKLGITAANIDGPFKLEIDYIGLEYDPYHKETSPYELYSPSTFPS